MKMILISASFFLGSFSVNGAELEGNMSNLFVFWPIIVFLILAAILVFFWYEKGKDPKTKEIISPKSLIPESLNPLEVSAIIHEGLKKEDIFAEVLHLGNKGYIKIKKIKEDYEFSLNREIAFLGDWYDKRILALLFGEGEDLKKKVRLSELNKVSSSSISEIERLVIDSLLEKSYYSNFPKFKNLTGGLLVFSVLMIFLIGGLIFETRTIGGGKLEVVVFLASIIFSALFALKINSLMPAKTKKGVKTRNYFLSFRKNLVLIALNREEDDFFYIPRIKIENLIPYSIVLGQEKEWPKLKEIGEINLPKWLETEKEQRLPWSEYVEEIVNLKKEISRIF